MGLALGLLGGDFKPLPNSVELWFSSCHKTIIIMYTFQINQGGCRLFWVSTYAGIQKTSSSHCEDSCNGILCKLFQIPKFPCEIKSCAFLTHFFDFYFFIVWPIVWIFRVQKIDNSTSTHMENFNIFAKWLTINIFQTSHLFTSILSFKSILIQLSWFVLFNVE